MSDGNLDSANHGAPAKFTIDSDHDNGSLDQFKYQLRDTDGNALAGPGYKAAEIVTPDIKGQNANWDYRDLDHGVYTDNVGFDGYGPIPITAVKSDYIQWLSVTYKGECYPISNATTAIKLCQNHSSMTSVPLHLLRLRVPHSVPRDFEYLGPW